MKVTIGASRKTTLLAPVGTTVSLTNSLSPSASGCSRPNGPDRHRPLAQLHGADHLALGVGDVGHRHAAAARRSAGSAAPSARRARSCRTRSQPWVPVAPSSPPPREQRAALRHHRRGPADRVGLVEVRDRRDEAGPVELAAAWPNVAPGRGGDHVDRRPAAAPARPSGPAPGPACRAAPCGPAPRTGRAGSSSPPWPRRAGTRRACRAAAAPRC